MPVNSASAVVALLSGVVVGLALNRLIKQRAPQIAVAARAAARGRAQPWLGAGGLAARVGAPGRSPWGRLLFLANLAVVGAGALALGLFPAVSGGFALSQALLLFFLLYALAVLDLLTLTVEAPVLIAGLVLRLGAVLLAAREQAPAMLGGALAGAGLFYLIGFIYEAVRDRQGLGEGDPAVLALVGAFVGWQGVVPVVLLSTALGLAVGFPMLLLFGRPLNTPLPFVPFLCAGGLAVYLAQAQGWQLWSGSLYLP